MICVDTVQSVGWTPNQALLATLIVVGIFVGVRVLFELWVRSKRVEHHDS